MFLVVPFVQNIFRSILLPISTDPEDIVTVPSGSDTLPRSVASVPGKSFFSRWLKMTSFHKRWAALPFLEDERTSGCFPLVKATQDTTTLPALKQQIGQSVGDSGSAWELLQRVLGYMYMEVCAVPAPPAALTVKKIGTITARGELSSVAGGKSNSELTIPTFFVKPMCTFALPPACNVVYPSMIDNYTFQENYIRQPTRLYLSEQYMSDIITESAEGAITDITKGLMVTGYPNGVRRRMKDLLEKSSEVSNKNFLLFAEEYYKGPITKRMSAPPWMYMLQQQYNANASLGVDPGLESRIAEVVDLDDEDIASPLGALFDTYAKFEYFRARYAEGSGGLSLQWNPYIVPGFPIAIFDQRNAGFDTMGYVNTVTHALSAAGGGSMNTSVSLTFMRTFSEFAGLLDEEESVIDIAPSEVIPEVRDAFQRVTNAHELYKRMLYRAEPMNKAAVFDWKQFMDVTNQYGDILDLQTDDWEADPYISLTPKPETEGLFESYDAAMQYASRPACTLKEYIETWHNRSLSSLLEDGTVQGEYDSFF